jgi:hypothetical protein
LNKKRKKKENKKNEREERKTRTRRELIVIYCSHRRRRMSPRPPRTLGLGGCGVVAMEVAILLSNNVIIINDAMEISPDAWHSCDIHAALVWSVPCDSV